MRMIVLNFKSTIVVEQEVFALWTGRQKKIGEAKPLYDHLKAIKITKKKVLTNHSDSCIFQEAGHRSRLSPLQGIDSRMVPFSKRNYAALMIQL